MNPELISLINFQYNRKNGPGTSWEAAVREGVNCQWFVHEFVRANLGISLPKHYMSKEIFEDPQKIFYTVNPKQDTLEKGDILIVSRRKNANLKKLHLAIYVDQQNVVHANSFDQAVSEWPLHKLFENYPVLWGIKRLGNGGLNN